MSVISLVIFVFVFSVVRGHNTYFTCSGYPTLKTGISLMGSSTRSSSTRSIVVKRGNQVLSSGDTYVAGETLSVTLSNKGGEIILETSGASFPSGSCNGKYRYYGSTASIKMPSSGDVNIWAGWAPQRGAVYITPKFLLVAETSSPTSVPTHFPSPIPTLSPTRYPTHIPTPTPTACPTRCPTSLPTSLPSSCPSASPSLAPTLFSAPPTGVPTSSAPTITYFPSCSPSAMPTSVPSSIPSAYPSAPPTAFPTSTPTLPPTSLPTLLPTSFPTPFPTACPTSLPTLHPTLSISSIRYSLQLRCQITGAESKTLHSQAVTIQSLICRNVSKPFSECIIMSLSSMTSRRMLSYSPYNANTVLLQMIIVNFASIVSSEAAASSINSYLTSSFADDVRGESSITISVSSMDFIAFNSASTNVFPYQCRFDSMKLSWFMDLFSEVHGVISGSHGWIAGGVVAEGSRLMVENPRHQVYMYDSNINLYGRFELSKYSTSGVLYLDNEGVTSAIRDNSTTYLQFRRLMKSRKELFMFAGGKTLSAGHGMSGFVYVHWEKGKCTPLTYLSPVIYEFYIGLAALLVLNVVCTKYASKNIPSILSRRITRPASYVPRIVTDISIGGALGTTFVLLWLILYCIFAARRYIDDGYSMTRAYSIATGHIAVHLLALALLPITRNSVWLHLINCPFERAIKYHRVFAVTTVLVSSIHFALIEQEWTFDYLLENGGMIGQALPIFGFIALLAMYIMLVTSYYYVRRLNYELFLVAHLLFLIVVLCVCLHVSSNVFFLVLPLVLYMGDVFYRWYQWTLTADIVNIQTYPEFTILTIRAPHIRHAKPGNYCYIYIPSMSRCQSHPFTIIPCSWTCARKKVHMNPETPTTVATRPVSGDLTKISSEISQIRGVEETFSIIVKSIPQGWTQGVLTSVTHDSAIHVTGPYGSLQHDLLSYQRIFLVFGGIGVTPMVGVMRYIVQHAEANDTYRPQVTIIFTTRDALLIDLFRDEFTFYANCAKISVVLHLFCTEVAPSVSKPDQKNKKQVKPANKKSNSRKLDSMLSVSDISVQACRPNVTSIVRDALKKNSSSTIAFVCGPNNLVDELKTVCQKHHVDVHTEIFEF